MNKLSNIDPLNAEEKKELERMYTLKLGGDLHSFTDGKELLPYLRVQIGITDEVITTKFGSFLNEQTLDADQLAFCQEIIDYVRKNGDITAVDLLKEKLFCNVDIKGLFGSNIGYIKQLIDISALCCQYNIKTTKRPECACILGRFAV